MNDLAQLIQSFTTWILPAVIAITLHEAAHGWVASKLGDDTAKRLGRVTFNPLAHVDPFGTVLLPGFLLLSGSPFMFGWAKPVPVNFAKLRRPRLDMALVAAAGPGINLILATIAAALIHGIVFVPDFAAEWVGLNLQHAVMFNIVLALFNLLPLPPLDGGRILVALLPAPLARAFAPVEKYGILILLSLLLVVPFIAQHFHSGFDPLSLVLSGPFDFVLRTIANLVRIPVG
jgi:Zn-dependent protease